MAGQANTVMMAGGVEGPRPAHPNGAGARPPFHRDGWVYEEKIDGWRMLAYRDGPRVRLVSRRGVDHTARFHELAAALTKLRADPLVLDGEVAVFDAKLVSRFHLLGDEQPTELCTPPLYMAFDVLQAGKGDTGSLPLEQRRVILENVTGNGDLVHPVRRLPDDGAKAWAMVEERGYEGMVAKDPHSTYRPGRTRAWVKVKQRREGVFVIGGITTTSHGFAGVLVGQRAGRTLRFLGTIEMGYSTQAVSELRAKSQRLSSPSSPFVDLPSRRDVTWLAPKLLCEVSYNEIVAGRFRAAVWRGFKGR